MFVLDTPSLGLKRQTKPKANGARTRQGRKYQSRRRATTTTRGTFDCTPKPQDAPPSNSHFVKFVKQTHHSVPAGKNKPPVVVNVTKEPYTLSHGFLYCKCCKIMVKWNNRSKHVIGKKHIAKKNAAADTAEDLNEARTLAQQRIREEGLVGTTYTGDKLDSITLWLKVACAGNWSTASIEDNRVSGWFAVRHFLINPCSQVQLLLFSRCYSTYRACQFLAAAR